ncbi:HD domain-containing protein [Virgibacillus sp. NKC19-16]|uniref:HD domain-containing protein n=1 Tax=Virgibacillus salidurans TaxID=2831673 RepID=UPI001F39036C|nr:HD domain-containing protein [Virgibacillus sp. NKC19-16]UJL48057.1 HD domain-containing protein [Virgibacillus sp. NKC19-16]
MEKEKCLQAIRNYVHTLFHSDATGHDFFHMKRVARIAKEIAEQEKADLFITEVSAWLHDIGDEKLFSDSVKATKDMITFLESIGLSNAEIIEIKKAIRDVSFRKEGVPATLEGKIVQDADRIDAIGAVGIARTFAYGGAKKQLIYHRDFHDTSIQHFYNKLLTLKDLLHTTTASEIAQERHVFMEKFLEQFYKEW